MRRVASWLVTPLIVMLMVLLSSGSTVAQDRLATPT